MVILRPAGSLSRQKGGETMTRKEDNESIADAIRKSTAAAGVPEEHAAANPMDAFMRAVAGRPAPTRNDCGYPGRLCLAQGRQVPA
jgi:hypothetical protein